MMSEAMNRREFLSRRGLGEMLRKAAPLLGINGEGVAGDGPRPGKQVYRLHPQLHPGHGKAAAAANTMSRAAAAPALG